MNEHIFPQYVKENRRIFFGSSGSCSLLSKEICLKEICLKPKLTDTPNLLTAVDSSICFQMLMGIR